MGKRWRYLPHDADRIDELQRQAGVPSVVAQLLLCRGVHQVDAAKSFMAAKMSGLREPGLLPGVAAAVAAISAAIKAKQRIIVYGDYDADGMTGAAILIRCLRMLEADVGYYVPNRLEEGYGLSDEALEKLAARGAKMVISVDCGIASVQQAATAKRLGLQLIITDHHTFGETLPEATALVHPRLPNDEGGDYPFGGLCGAGVAFKLAWALCQDACQSTKVDQRQRNFLLSAIGLAAMGTVADVVPLLDENRLIVRHGLVSLKQRPVLGIAKLMEVTKLAEKPQLGAEDIAFTLGPRLNAAGRLGQAQLGVELLTTENRERAEALAEYIHELNKSRDSLERSIYLAALKQAQEEFDPENDPALVLAGHGWHAGVIGIVAGRLAEKFHLPVVVISLDKSGVKPGTGSARTASGLNLYQAIASSSDSLLGFGGHAAAAGLTIEEGKIDEFRAGFCEYAASEISTEQRIAEVQIDAEAPLSQLTLQTVMQIEQLAPFGEANPRPILSATGVELVGEPKTMGAGDRHLQLRIKQHNVTLRALAFGQAEWLGPLAELGGPFDIAYRPVVNEFRGYRSVELHLVDWRAAAPTADAAESGEIRESSVEG